MGINSILKKRIHAIYVRLITSFQTQLSKLIVVGCDSDTSIGARGA